MGIGFLLCLFAMGFRNSYYNNDGLRHEWQKWQILFVLLGLVPILGIIAGVVFTLCVLIGNTDKGAYMHEESFMYKIGEYLSSPIRKDKD